MRASRCGRVQALIRGWESMTLRGMKTVRPFGLAALGWMLTFGLSGCGSFFEIYQTTCVTFTEAGAPVILADAEYAALRGDLRALLAKRRYGLEDSRTKSPIVATIEITTVGSAPNRRVVGMRVARVDLNPDSRVKSKWSSDVAGIASNAQHPSLELAHSLDRTFSSGDNPSGR